MINLEISLSKLAVVPELVTPPPEVIIGLWSIVCGQLAFHENRILAFVGYSTGFVLPVWLGILATVTHEPMLYTCSIAGNIGFVGSAILGFMEERSRRSRPIE